MITGPSQIGGFTAGNPGASHSTPTLGPTYVEVISMPNVDHVGGSFRISGAQYLREVSAPKLISIDGGLEIDQTILTSVDFPALQSTVYDIYLTGAFTS